MIKFKRILLSILIATLSFSNFTGGVHNWVLEHPDGLEAKLTHTIVPDRGDSTPSFTRATTATFEDFEGIIREVKIGESRHKCARRVENLMAVNSEDMTSGYTIDSGGTINSATQVSFDGTANVDLNPILGTYPIVVDNNDYDTYVFSVNIELVSGNISGDGGVMIRMIGDAVPATIGFVGMQLYNLGSARFTIEVTTDAGGTELYPNIRVSDAVVLNITDWQVEKVTGQSNQNPSEYVSTGVLSAPYHGCNVDGVKYFPYENGNTVASNVVTEARGADIPHSTLKGVMIENQATNLVTYSDDLTQWDDTNVTASTDKILETAVNNVHKIAQLNIQSSETDYHSLRVVAKSIGRDYLVLTNEWGDNYCYATYDFTNGTISEQDTNGTGVILNATMNVLSEAGYYECILVSKIGTAGNDAITIQPSNTGTPSGTTNTYLGDVTKGFYIKNIQLEQGVHATSYIPTEATTKTRNADILSYTSSGVIDSTKGSMSAEFTTEWITQINNKTILSVGPNRYAAFIRNGNLAMYDGINNITGDSFTGSSSLQKIATNWGGSSATTFQSGTASIQGTFDNDFDASLLGIGIRADNGDNPLNGTIKNLKIWKRKLPTNLMIGETTL